MLAAYGRRSLVYKKFQIYFFASSGCLGFNSPARKISMKKIFRMLNWKKRYIISFFIQWKKVTFFFSSIIQIFIFLCCWFSINTCFFYLSGFFDRHIVTQLTSGWDPGAMHPRLIGIKKKGREVCSPTQLQLQFCPRNIFTPSSTWVCIYTSWLKLCETFFLSI